MRTIHTLFLLLICISANAQTGDWEVLYPNFSATSVAAKGNTILVGTDGAGMSVFDTMGNRQQLLVANSGLPSNHILQAAIDPEGHWWVSTEAGFSRFDGTDWESWSQTAAGLSGSDVVRVLKAAPDGSIYAGTQFAAPFAGVVIFQNNTWQQLNSGNSGLPSNDVRDIAFDQNGHVYFATSAGLAIFDGSAWTIHNAASTGSSFFNNVKSVAVTDSGTVWATIDLNRFAKLEAGTWTVMGPADIALPAGSGFSGGVFYDEFDRLWLTHTKTISVLSGGNWTHYPETEVGCTFPVSLQNSVFLAVDGAGRTWSTACGLSRFDGQTWGQLPTTNADLPNGYVFSISEDAGGSMWFGTTDGFAKLDDMGNWTAFDPADFGATSTFSDIYDILTTPDGEVWVGMDNSELLRFDGMAWELFDTCSMEFPGTFVRASAAAPNGDRWFSLAPTGVFFSLLARYSANGDWTFFSPNNSPLQSGADIEAIAIGADGAVWLGSTNKGLFRFDGANWTVFTAAGSGLPNDWVHDITFAPDGALWACTEAGLASFDGTDWTVLNSSNSGLPSDTTYRIAFDGLGGMYVGYDIPDEGPQVAEFRNGDWTELAAPGFENLVADPPYAFTVDSKNRLWFTQVYYDFQNSLAPVFRYDPMVSGTAEGVDNGFQITAFPNPTASNVSLQWPTGWSGEALLQVRNAQGRVVQAASLSVAAGQSVPVNLGSFPAGIYWLTVYQGSRVATVKVVKR